MDIFYPSKAGRYVFTAVYSILIFALGRNTFCQNSFTDSKIKYLATWSKKTTDIDIKNPQSISVSPDGSVYIADTGNNRIVKFNNKGVFISEQGGFGWGQKQFDSPVSICSKNGLDVLVADYFNDRIVRFDKDLNYIASLYSNDDWEENFRFGFPVGVDISSQGELFCIDGENKRILKFDVAGNPQLQFGGFSAGRGRLSSPSAILVSDQNMVYVSDDEYGVVRVFDIHGNFLFDMGGGVLKQPAGIADLNNNGIAVTDRELKCIFIFSSDKKSVKKFILSDYAYIKFYDPVDIAYRNNILYVVDAKRSAVDLFKCIW